MKNILTKIFSSKKNLSSKEISFSEITKKTKVSEIFNAILNYNEISEIRYVGGCVRKILNDEEFDDIDLATNLSPEEVKECLKKNKIDFFETGIDHGTITARIDEKNFEITSLRKDILTDGRRAVVEFTKECVKLGWQPKMEPFDILPLVVQIGSQAPEWREIPKEIITLVPIEHPSIKAIKDLKLQWYSTPIISNMTLEVGGIEFMAAPFNGWYMGTEIGARNLADEDRYNLLPTVAELMGLDVLDKNTLWKDRALIELNQAVLYSFRKAGVKIIDHHSASKQFMQFMRQEAKEGREVTADWSWIVPPTAGSTTKVFHTEMQDVIKSPNYYYQENSWD